MDEWDEAIEAAWMAAKTQTWPRWSFDAGELPVNREVVASMIRAAAPLIAAATLNKAADEADAMVFRNDGGPQWLRERAKEAGR